MNNEKRPGLRQQVSGQEPQSLIHNNTHVSKKQWLDFAEINRIALSQSESLLGRHFPGGKLIGKNYSLINPNRADKSRGSFAINVDTGLWSDFATADGGQDIISFFAYLGNTNYYEAALMLAEELGVEKKSSCNRSNRLTPKKIYSTQVVWKTIMPIPDNAPPSPSCHYSRGKFSTIWKYLDLEGALLGLVGRINHPDGTKDILPITYCINESGKVEWRFQAFPEPRPLYLGKNQIFSPDLPFLVVEGEKSCDAAAELFTHTYVSLSWPGGCKAVNKADFRLMTGKDIHIWPDKDLPGLLAAVAVIYAASHNMAKSITIILPPKFVPSGWDLADALCDGWDLELVNEWINDNSVSPDVFAKIILDSFELRDDERKKLEELLDRNSQLEPDKEPCQDGKISNSENQQWALAKRMFPKKDFPWEILPQELVHVFRMLAKSCATSPNPLPTTAIAILGTLLGSTIRVSPKHNWSEPLVYFVVNIQESGEGKSPPAHLLCKYIYNIQEEAEKKYQREMKEWTSQKYQDKGPIPSKPRSYFTTNATMEGVQTANIGHAGLLCNFDEISSFISAQNQYKKQGDDREGWLRLWSGSPSRTLRVNQANYVGRHRVTVIGGIPPATWTMIFGAQNGIYLHDGTIYRFLPIVGDIESYELDSTPWTDEQEHVWEQLLRRAKEWADGYAKQDNWVPLDISLNDEAQKVFFAWCNKLMGEKKSLPYPIQGFIKKSISYALRSAGGINCLCHFMSSTENPCTVIAATEMEKGIKLVEFHLGHAVHAMQLFCKPDGNHDSSDPFTKGYSNDGRKVIETLKLLRKDVDDGKLAIGYVQEKFEELHQLKISSKAIGRILRKELQLNVSTKKVCANKRRNIHALSWDKKAEKLVSEVCDVSIPIDRGGSTKSTSQSGLSEKQDMSVGLHKVESGDEKVIILNHPSVRVSKSMKPENKSALARLKQMLLVCFGWISVKS